MTVARASQVVVEVLSASAPKVRVSQAVVEVLSSTAVVTVSPGGKRKPRPWQAGSVRGSSYKRP